MMTNYQYIMLKYQHLINILHLRQLRHSIQDGYYIWSPPPIISIKNWEDVDVEENPGQAPGDNGDDTYNDRQQAPHFVAVIPAPLKTVRKTCEDERK